MQIRFFFRSTKFESPFSSYNCGWLVCLNGWNSLGFNGFIFVGVYFATFFSTLYYISICLLQEQLAGFDAFCYMCCLCEGRVTPLYLFHCFYSLLFAVMFRAVSPHFLWSSVILCRCQSKDLSNLLVCNPMLETLSIL